jgi:hypothetical protein
MSQRPISRSEDLQQLREEGYDISVHSPAHLLLKSVPYVTSTREVKRGILVSTLHLANDVTQPPDTHVAHFVGETPCRSDGTPLAQIINASNQQTLAPGLTIDHTFSSKPASGHYENYYEKMTTYVRIIENEAHALDPSATAKTFPVVLPEEEDSVFLYEDTASSRAKIGAITDRLRHHTIAIIGLGGTGSYILDLVAKTPVRAIHLYDGDRFGQHNAFRSPGAAASDDLHPAQQKAEYFQARYARMRKNISAHPYYVDETNIEELRAADFVFICIDRNSARKLISEHLEAFGIPFIDTGMGIPHAEESLGGILRITTSTPEKRAHFPACVALEDADVENEYERNVQVADLNALNAALAVIKWKKLCGFYDDTRHEHHATYTIRANMLLNEEEA